MRCLGRTAVSSVRKRLCIGNKMFNAEMLDMCVYGLKAHEWILAGLVDDFQQGEDVDEAGRNVSINFVLNLAQGTSSQECRIVVTRPQRGTGT